MRRTLLLPALLAFFLLPPAVSTEAGAVPPAGGAERGSAAGGNNAFACDLYARLSGGEGNLFFSPYSVSTALGMTYAGARGETARQMAKVLHFDLPPERLHPSMAGLMEMLNAEGKSYKLSAANALWGQAGYRWKKEFLDVTGKYYGAGLREVDFIDAGRREEARRTINRWTEEKTGNRIRDLIRPDVLDSLTRLVLTNAIYFKGQWKFKFQPENTASRPFHVAPDKTVDVPLMRRTGSFRYSGNDRMQVVELPYAGDDLAMVVLLPRPGRGLGGPEAALTPENLRKWLASLSDREVDVFLPRFRMEKQSDLGRELAALGMPDAFDDKRADFSGMTADDRLSISKVIHKAFVEVNEEGTEAAAATAVVVGVKSFRPEPPAVFRADRPFLFLIRDLRSGAVLFAGRLADPGRM
ncbi:MAG: hypothetical protein H6Q84_2978 [Deltaproteobacteria bacterium]|nr:hypothetical protein [Deltaproteobacteria bacterium]